VKIKAVCVSLCVFAALPFAETLHAQGTAFTYQGRLDNSGSPASGLYNFTFTIFDASNGVSPATLTLTNSAVAVTNGLFTTTLDFGGDVFSGNPAWLEIAVTTNGGANFTTLSPRQLLTPTPYAIFANTASNLLGSLQATQLSGVLPSSQISGTYSGAVTFSNSANQFNGNGTNLVNLNASQLTGGTVADARLSSNVAFLNGTQTFTGSNTFTNLYGNSFSGSFFGNGLVGWIPTNGTAIQAAIDTGYLLTNSQSVTVTLPVSPHPGDIVRISGAGAGGWLIKENSGQSILGNFASYSNSFPVGLPTSGNYQDVAASADGTRMYAVGSGFSGVQASSDSGLDWSQAGSLAPFCQSVACSANGRIVYVVTTAGAVYMSTNSGAAWTQIISSGYTTISCTADGSQYFTGNIVCSGNGTYRAKFTSSSISVSTNGGASYSVNVPVPASNLSCLAVSGDCTRLVAGVSSGLLYGSANLGATWTSITISNQFWSGAWMSEDGGKFAAAVSNNGSTTGGIFAYGVSAVPNTISTNSTISGSQSTAVELQFIGNNQFMPVSSAGTIWAY
jgi:hypothetical protein